MKINNKRI